MKRFLLSGLLFIPFAFLQAARPTVSMSASPTTIILGGSSTLTWTSTGATSASINNGIGSVPVNGSISVTPSKTTSYTITVRNSSGSRTASAKVTVKAAPPTVTFTSSPTSIIKGQSSTLSWTTTNATSASINQNIGTVALNGSRTVTPTATITYKITVKGTGGTITASATVMVTTAPPPTVSLSVEPSAIQSGQQAVLSWTSTDATSAEIDNDIGSVTVNGSQAVSPVQNTTYRITVNGPGGTATAQTTVYITNGKRCLAYVANSGSDTVSAIDAATNTIIKTIAVNRIPKGILIDKDGARVYVTHDLYNYSSSIAIIDTGSNAIVGYMSPSWVTASIEYPVEHPDGRYIYGASLTSYWISEDYLNESILYIFDTVDKCQVKALRIPGKRQGSIAVHPDGTRLYLSLPEDDKVLCLDTAKLHQPLPGGQGTALLSDEASATIPATGPTYMAVSPTGNRLYVSLASGIAVIDTISNNIISTIDLGNNRYAYSLAIHPDGSRLIVACNDSTLLLVDTATQTVVKQAALETYCSYLGLHPDGGRIYMTNGLDKNVKAINAATLAVDATIAVGKSPSNYGRFVGYTAETVSGQVTADGAGLGGVNVRIENITFSTTAVTDEAGHFITALKSGSYTVTPEKVGYIFSPDQQQIVVDQSVSGCDFTATVQTPTVTISAQPTTVRQGQPTTVTWSSTHATSAVLDDGTGPSYCPVNGWNEYTISKTTTYTVTVTGPGGTATSNIMVIFDSSTTPTVSITANPATINPGESSTLTWQSYFASTAEMDNNIGIVPVNGSRIVTPTATTTYKITVTGSGGMTGTATATVVVTGSVPSVVISASPASILEGGSSTLTWTTANAATASIDNNIGAVPVNGSVSVSPASTTTYILTANGPGGSNSASVKVTVEKVPPTVTFSASPEYIPPGGSSTLTWTTKDATSVSLDQGIGVVDASGSHSVSPTSETVYTLTATGPGGTTTASAVVKMLVTHLNSVWNGMKSEIFNGNITQAAGYFSEQTREKYSSIFNAIADQLPQIAMEMRDIEPVYFEEYGAKFRIKRTEEIEGVTYDITYYIYFVQNEDGSWKILNY